MVERLAGRGQAQRQAVPLESPKFLGFELEQLEAIMRSPLWVKIKQRLDCRLIETLLNGMAQVTDEYRRGYLACRAELDYLPRPAKQKEDDDSATSMQMAETIDDDMGIPTPGS